MDIALIVGSIFLFVGLIIGAAFSLTHFPIIARVVPLVFVLLGGFLVYRSVRKMMNNRKLRENGNKLYAEIVSMVPNYNYTINYRHTFILHCEANFAPYECEYPKTSADGLVGKRITVYVNPEDPEDYFVDLKSIT